MRHTMVFLLVVTLTLVALLDTGQTAAVPQALEDYEETNYTEAPPPTTVYTTEYDETYPPNVSTPPVTVGGQRYVSKPAEVTMQYEEEYYDAGMLSTEYEDPHYTTAPQRAPPPPNRYEDLEYDTVPPPPRGQQRYASTPRRASRQRDDRRPPSRRRPPPPSRYEAPPPRYREPPYEPAHPPPRYEEPPITTQNTVHHDRILAISRPAQHEEQYFQPIDLKNAKVAYTKTTIKTLPGPPEMHKNIATTFIDKEDQASQGVGINHLGLLAENNVYKPPTTTKISKAKLTMASGVPIYQGVEEEEEDEVKKEEEEKKENSEGDESKDSQQSPTPANYNDYYRMYGYNMHGYNQGYPSPYSGYGDPYAQYGHGPYNGHHPYYGYGHTTPAPGYYGPAPYGGPHYGYGYPTHGPGAPLYPDINQQSPYRVPGYLRPRPPATPIDPYYGYGGGYY